MRKNDFIVKAIEKHGDKYDYSKVDYTNNRTKVCIICPEHGEFWQTPHNHLSGSICPKCALTNRANKLRSDKDNVIERFKGVHGDMYDYSKVEYKNNRTKVCIICPEHGEFWQTPESHLRGQGCPKCAGKFMDANYFIEKSKEIHGDRYNYSLVKYKNVHDKVCIICPEHGEFWQTPHHHLDGFGCKKCSNNFLDRDMFINKAIEIHGVKYDYSKVVYKNNRTKVCIICPEHGEFWQTPNSHLNGRGCKMCKESHLERDVGNILKRNQINFTYQYHNKEIFGLQSIDYFLNDGKIAIECQGEQHFLSNFFKSKGIEYAEKHLEYIQKLDERKREICKVNGIHLIYFLNRKFNKFLSNDIIFANNENELIGLIREIMKNEEDAMVE